MMSALLISKSGADPGNVLGVQVSAITEFLRPMRVIRPSSPR